MKKINVAELQDGYIRLTDCRSLQGAFSGSLVDDAGEKASARGSFFAMRRRISLV